jgi:hypothetical protein
MSEINKTVLTLISACVLGLSLSACNRAESPEKTEADVSRAQTAGAKNVANERETANSNTMDAEKDVIKANAELSHESAKGHHDMTVAKAESSHKVAIEQCESMTGDAQTSCKKQADLTLAEAKTQAETVERAADPKK